MTDEFVTRAMYTAMVAERDALAVAGREVLARVAELTVERDALAARVARSAEPTANHHSGYNDPWLIEGAELAALRAQLAAAHGLLARAERAEAALAEALGALEVPLHNSDYSPKGFGCEVCEEEAPDAESIKHDDDCPAATLRAALAASSCEAPQERSRAVPS